VHVSEHYSGLVVAWSEQDEKRIQQEIRQLDPALFLDPERDPETRQLFWTVKQWMGSGMRPHRVLVWRDPDGTPRPLSFAIVEELKRKERKQDAERAFLETLRENEEHLARLKAQTDAEYDAVDEEHRKRIRAAELDSLPPFWRPRRFGADMPKKET
jgi:hypothetical protein